MRGEPPALRPPSSDLEPFCGSRRVRDNLVEEGGRIFGERDLEHVLRLVVRRDLGSSTRPGPSRTLALRNRASSRPSATHSQTRPSRPRRRRWFPQVSSRATSSVMQTTSLRRRPLPRAGFANDHDRPVRLGEHLPGGTAEHGALDTAKATGSDDDQLGVDISRKSNDLLWRVTDQQLCLRGDATLSCPLRGLAQGGIGLRTGDSLRRLYAVPRAQAREATSRARKRPRRFPSPRAPSRRRSPSGRSRNRRLQSESSSSQSPFDAESASRSGVRIGGDHERSCGFSTGEIVGLLSVFAAATLNQ